MPTSQTPTTSIRIDPRNDTVIVGTAPGWAKLSPISSISRGSHEKLITRGWAFREGNAFEKTRARSARRRILSLDGTHWLIENGHREVSKKAAVRYARFFRVDLDWLLTGKGVGTGVTPPPPQDGTPPPITDATLTEIWSQLPERNRRKLVQIALILSGEG